MIENCLDISSQWYESHDCRFLSESTFPCRCLMMHTWEMNRLSETVPCHHIHTYSIVIFVIAFFVSSAGILVSRWTHRGRFHAPLALLAESGAYSNGDRPLQAGRRSYSVELSRRRLPQAWRVSRAPLLACSPTSPDTRLMWLVIKYLWWTKKRVLCFKFLFYVGGFWSASNSYL